MKKKKNNAAHDSHDILTQKWRRSFDATTAPLVNDRLTCIPTVDIKRNRENYNDVFVNCLLLSGVIKS